MELQVMKLLAPTGPDRDYHARFRPSRYLHIVQSEARCQVYSFFLETLRVHEANLSRRYERKPDPSSPRRLVREIGRWHAPDALKAIGKWWMKLARHARPRVTPREKKALGLCARFARFEQRQWPKSGAAVLKWVERFADAMAWENKRFVAEGRRRAPK